MSISKKVIAISFSTTLLASSLAGCSYSNDVAKVIAPKLIKTIATQIAPGEVALTVANSHQSETISHENISYTVGYNVAGNLSAQLQAQDINLDNKLVLAGFKAGTSNKQSAFTPEKMDSIMQDFKKNLRAEQEKKLVTSVLKNAKALLSNEQTPTIGSKKAKVAVVEFFDYQCDFCHKVATIMEKVMDANPNVKYVFKEFPIFGQRWEASQYAAEMGIAAYMLNGPNNYLKYHNAIFANDVDEGKLTITDVNAIAKKAGIDITKAENLIKEKKVAENLSADMKLVYDMIGIQGTPTIIIMPLSGATENNTTVIPGFETQETIEAAIKKAQDN